MLNFYQWCKTLSSTFSKIFSTTTPNFLHVFGRAPSDLQLCFVQLKTLAPSARYSTFKYPMTLKPGLGVTQGHRKLYQSIRHPRLPMFHRNHRPISHRFRHKRQFPSKIANFSYPRVYIAPDEGVSLGIWYRRKGSQMLKWWGYQKVEKVLR